MSTKDGKCPGARQEQTGPENVLSKTHLDLLDRKMVLLSSKPTNGRTSDYPISTLETVLFRRTCATSETQRGLFAPSLR